jgi:hypothetical protein
MTSSDNGGSWSAPRNVTTECSAPYGGGVTGSEGHGIQLASGELIMPLYFSGGKPMLLQGLCRSSDHGNTWSSAGAMFEGAGSKDARIDHGGEGEIVELFGKTARGGPRLMYDVRIAWTKEGGVCTAAEGCRATYTSEDLGATSEHRRSCCHCAGSFGLKSSPICMEPAYQRK